MATTRTAVTALPTLTGSDGDDTRNDADDDDDPGGASDGSGDDTHNTEGMPGFGVVTGLASATGGGPSPSAESSRATT